MQPILIPLAIVFAAACGGSEAARITLPVVIDGNGVIAASNDLGWSIALTQFRVATNDLQFTIRGEQHDGTASRAIRRFFVSDVYAHPGHLAGGVVTGELPGNFLLDFTSRSGNKLGDASLLVGAYHGFNLTFRRADAADFPGVVQPDPLLGHTADFAGKATKGAQQIQFTALVDIDDGTAMVGAPFDFVVDKSTTATIGVAAVVKDPYEPDTLFDGIDFGALDADGDGVVAIAPGEAAHNILRREIIVHDQWLGTTKPTAGVN